MALTAQHLTWLSLILLALGGGLMLVRLVQHLQRQWQQHRYLDHWLLRRPAAGQGDDARPAAEGDWWAHSGERLLASGLGRALVADEDKALLVQCGSQSPHHQARYLLARCVLALGLPLLVALLAPASVEGQHRVLALVVALVLGVLLPKWGLRSWAQRRRRQAGRELPLLVDLLRLLQGTGMSLDQSLQLIGKDFQDVMPVLAPEVVLANQLYASGRTREQAFVRLGEMFQNESLADLSAVLLQIDQHGGAVQEPLRLFGERLREQRRAQMKEAIGKTTVKMTGVMVLTLLPALLIVTAGPGFLAVVRALGAMT